MSVNPAPYGLDATVTAQWRRRLAGPTPDERTHWRTKTAYYRAVIELIESRPPAPLSWRTIVESVRPRGNRSTFYEVTGPHAKHPLIRDLLTSGQTDTMQLALGYRRSGAVEQLVDEAKVWAFWPYREGWLDQCRLEPGLGERHSAASLESVVAGWARQRPALAAALAFAPPACAVEDLMVVQRGRLSATHAIATLSRAMRDAVGIADGVMDAGQAELAATDDAVSAPDTLLVGLAEQIYAMSREAPGLGPSAAGTVRTVGTELMLDAVLLLA